MSRARCIVASICWLLLTAVWHTLALAAKQAPEPVGKYNSGDSFKDCDSCPKMVVVPAGSFMMGSPASEKQRDKDEGPRHKVRIPRAFAVGKFEVTKAQFEAFVKDTGHDAGNECYTYKGGDWKERSGRSWRNPGFSQGGDHPVACVNWDDAKAYVVWLARKTGKSYRLLSEAEWEYAARAGTTTPFSTGGKITTDQANFDGNYTYNGSRKGRYRGKTVSVGSFAKNAFGLHDLHGNVWEWVEDCWNDSYSSAPSDGSVHTHGDCSLHVLRGGSWYYNPWYLRSALRDSFSTVSRISFVGFRVARTLTP